MTHSKKPDKLIELALFCNILPGAMVADALINPGLKYNPNSFLFGSNP